MARKRTKPSKSQSDSLVQMFPNEQMEAVRDAISRYPVPNSFRIDTEPRNRQNHLVKEHFAVHAKPGADASMFFAILDGQL